MSQGHNISLYSISTGFLLIEFNLGDLLQRTAIGFIVLVAVFLGIIWTLVNFYNYYPLVQRSVDIIVARIWSTIFGAPEPDNGTNQMKYESEFIFPTTSPATESEFIFPADNTEEKYDSQLPSISLLIPAYKEAEVIANSIHSVYRASYPQELLSVTILVEPDDYATRGALEELSKEYPFETLVVPTEYPGDSNKPRALNYGFEHADGEIIGIVDAEVVLGKGLLKEAAETLTNGADFALSHLDMVNEDDGWLNLLFRAEYGYWYNKVIPAFEYVGYPIPLGGTSCFFRREVLAEISESRLDEYDSPWSKEDWSWFSDHDLKGSIPWDPKNVTEDFELGLYLWVKGYKFAYLEGVTKEESPLGLEGWMEQRTRWKKGKLYTFRQYVEYPPETLWQRIHLYWQSLLPHLGPINIGGLIFVFWLANMAGAIPPLIVQGILVLGPSVFG